jgi:pectate lyase
MKQKIILGLLAAAAAGGAFAADAPNGWTKCTQNKGTVCEMTGTHQVTLGKNGVFSAFQTITGSFVCSNATFPDGSTATSAWCSYNPQDLGSGSSSSASSVASSSAPASSSSSSISSSSSSVSSSSSSVATTSSSSVSSASSSSVTGGAAIDAKTLTGASTPLQNVSGSYTYGVRNYLAPAIISGLHNPSNYKAVPASLITWQFATVDPTGGKMTFERATAPQNGWHTFSRKGKVIVTGGASAAPNRVYTVFNGQQLVAALAQAGNEPKIVRIVGHIDLRWSNNNTTFTEYTSYMDQKFGGSIMVPSNTTLVGINDAQGRAARITGTTLLIGGEAANCTAPSGQVAAEYCYKAWIAAGKDSEDYPTWTRNIILRNLQIDAPWDVNPEDSGNAYADAMTLSRAQNVYIDHVSMGDGDTPDSLASDTRHDGLLDIVRGSDYVTVTNSYFFKHHKTTLIGNGDSGRAWSDDGRMHVTLSNNFWDRLESRLPLNRFGQVHMFNNYIYGRTDSSAPADLKFGSGVDPRYKSNMLVENMYFEITELSPTSFCGKAIDDGNASAIIGFRSSGHMMLSSKKVNNVPNTTPVAWDGQCGYAAPTGANLWMPPYAYSLKTAADAKTFVVSNSGAGKLK